MTNATTLTIKEETALQPGSFNAKQTEILKNSICKGITNEEFEIFLLACKKTQLDPFMKQIYAIKRKSKRPDGSWGETMTIQTGIDGYRLIAERTGKYAPGKEPTFVCDEQGKVVSATAYIKKMTSDGTWHEVSSSAYMEEYCQTTTDKVTQEKRPTGMWVNMARTMLAKCAEAQALRKAFPAEMSGVYTKEEMEQADPIDITPKMSEEQIVELNLILDQCDENYRNWVFDYLKKQYKTNSMADIPADMFERIKSGAQKNVSQNTIRSMQTPYALSEVK